MNLPNAVKPKGNPRRKNRPTYKDVVCAFDIETTSLKKYKQAIMYIWQFQIGTDITIIGRTWDEFLQLAARLREILGGVKLVTYVHNLSFEYVFLSGIHHFAPEDVFCTEPRNILYADMPPFEFRCSYRLSNMSLDQFTKQMKVEHQKLSGEEFDYSKKRYPWTKLKQSEIDYATYDVIGLVEAVMQLMKNEGRNLYNIEMTSTGFVRTDEKRAMKTFNWSTMGRMIPDFEIHKYLRRAFRGGNTHADRHFVGQILHDVHSWDMESAYPSAMINKEFPMGRWYVAKPEKLNIEFLNDLINRRHKAVIMKVAFKNIHLKDPRWPVPYLSYDKCDNVILVNDKDLYHMKWNDTPGRRIEIAMDNGRIMAAEHLECVITDLDLQIISNEYEWDEDPGMVIKYLAFSSYGKLPEQIRRVVMEYYRRKTELKDVEGQEFLYDMSKRKLNAIYGGTVMDPIRIQYFYDDSDHNMERTDNVPYRSGFIYDDQSDLTLEEQYEIYEKGLYEEAVKWPYQSYAWGCWVSNWCRFRLHAGIKCVYEQGEKEYRETGRRKTHFVYCDTDSIKFVGDADIASLNGPFIEESEKNEAFAVDKKGRTHYLGVYEYEGCMKRFITWGSKKYAYEDQKGELHITIAGVQKKKGAEELKAHGGLDALKPDAYGRPRFIFRESGGVDAVYNDRPKISEILIDGHKLPITSNVYLEPHAYTLSITDDFQWIISHPDDWRKLVDVKPYEVV